MTAKAMFGETPYEAKLSKNDYDLLHIVLWRKAEDLCLRQGRCKEINGIKVLSLEDAIKEGVLFFVREPKSPHGVDTSPGGHFISVGGKLAPYATVYSTEKIKQAIADKKFEGQDRYGVPILDYGSVVAGQVEVCLGPLHTEFDGRGNAYISCFVENVVTKFTLGSPEYRGDKPFTVVDKVQIHYNVGHICVPESNSPNPAGKYLVALNKWSIDRFFPVGPLKPQNFQLIDISGDKMRLLAEVPVGWGEPHYAKAIRAEKIKPLDVYPVGTDPHVMAFGVGFVLGPLIGGVVAVLSPRGPFLTAALLSATAALWTAAVYRSPASPPVPKAGGGGGEVVVLVAAAFFLMYTTCTTLPRSELL